jgi:hypothetical protein
MPRKEFPKSVKVAVIKRATQGNIIICEQCGAIAKRFQIDHIDPDGLTGKPVIENAQLLCEPCYTDKNAKDTSNIAKAKRREAKYLGADTPTQKIQSAGFAKKPPKEPKQYVPHPGIYKDITP